jgi:N-acetylglucosamine-6-phosphate deacetylase
MLGVKDTKGTLAAGGDADLVVFSEERDGDGKVKLVVDEVWKFGARVY